MNSLSVDRVVARVIEAAGGKTALAKHLGLHRQALDYWRRVPAHHVIRVEQFIQKKITRHEIRPDIYPDKSF